MSKKNLFFIWELNGKLIVTEVGHSLKTGDTCLSKFLLPITRAKTQNPRE